MRHNQSNTMQLLGPVSRVTGQETSTGELTCYFIGMITRQALELRGIIDSEVCTLQKSTVVSA